MQAKRTRSALPAADRRDHGDQDGGEPGDRCPRRDELGGDAQDYDLARLHIAPHGCGGQDVNVVAQTGDLPVAHSEHNDAGKRELAGG